MSVYPTIDSSMHVQLLLIILFHILTHLSVWYGFIVADSLWFSGWLATCDSRQLYYTGQEEVVLLASWFGRSPCSLSSRFPGAFNLCGVWLLRTVALSPRNVTECVYLALHTLKSLTLVAVEIIEFRQIFFQLLESSPCQTNHAIWIGIEILFMKSQEPHQKFEIWQSLVLREMRNILSILILTGLSE